MATASQQDLRYAAEVTIPLIQKVYDRYETGNSGVVVPDVQTIADIHANTRRFAMLEASLDLASRKLVQDLVEQPAANPTLLGTIDFDPTTSTGFISFRGTKKGTEWVDDFKGVPVPFKGLGGHVPWVHRGFLEVWRLASESVVAGLANLPKVDRLLMTGHSLGSATASLCAIELATQHPAQKVACWTFASPRVFFGRPKRFNTAISSSIRVHNPVDIVTNVPPLPFLHVTGGVAIKAKLDDFHSLLKTYQPGIEALLHDVSKTGVTLEPSEDELLDLIDSAPDESVAANAIFPSNNNPIPPLA